MKGSLSEYSLEELEALEKAPVAEEPSILDTIKQKGKEFIENSIEHSPGSMALSLIKGETNEKENWPIY